MKWLIWLLLGSFVLGSIVVAPFVQYKQASTSHPKPRLQLTVENSFIGYESPETGNPFIVLELCVRNPPTSLPTIAELFGAAWTINDRAFTGMRMALAGPFTFHDPMYSRQYKIIRAEYIDEKTKARVEPGALERGWMVFDFPGLNLKAPGLTNKQFIVWCYDVDGNRIAVTNSGTSDNMRRDRPFIWPGSTIIDLGDRKKRGSATP